MNKIETYPSIINQVTDIVSAYLSHNKVPPEYVPTLIKETYLALVDNHDITYKSAETHERPTPAVPVDNSVHNDHIVCLEDGKELKMLKRHLKSNHNMTPAQYRKRWELDEDYPMVAPNYARKRSELAHDIGLGRSRKEPF